MLLSLASKHTSIRYYIILCVMLALQTTNFRTNEMKITFNCSLSGDWYELDAIQIKGTPYLGGLSDRIVQT